MRALLAVSPLFIAIFILAVFLLAGGWALFPGEALKRPPIGRTRRHSKSGHSLGHSRGFLELSDPSRPFPLSVLARADVRVGKTWEDSGRSQFPSQGGDTGSNPVGTTSLTRENEKPNLT